MIKHQTSRTKWHPAFVAAALAGAAIMIAQDTARAQGFFDFLFGGSQQRPAPPPEPAYPAPPPELGRVAPAPLPPQSVTERAGSTGHAVVFCVRLCDGEHFPMEHMVNGTPVETCRAICPYSKTKVFFGSEIASAVAADGQHYTNLDTAFAYRKQLVANCTCNGKDAAGLVSLDVKNDPTLRPGDIVSTKEGLMAFTGKGQAAAFAPVNPDTLPVDVKPGLAQPQQPAASIDPAVDEDPGTIVQPDSGHPAR